MDRTLQEEARGMNIDQNKINVLGFTDKLKSIENSLDYIVRSTKALEWIARLIDYI